MLSGPDFSYTPALNVNLRAVHGHHLPTSCFFSNSCCSWFISPPARLFNLRLDLYPSVPDLLFSKPPSLNILAKYQNMPAQVYFVITNNTLHCWSLGQRARLSTQTKANSPLAQNANSQPDSGKSQNIVKVHVERPGPVDQEQELLCVCVSQM